MSSAFVAFDEVRDHLQDALHAAGRPEGAPSIYVVRDRIGKVGISVSEEFGGDDRLRAALDGLARALHDRLGAHGRP